MLNVSLENALGKVSIEKKVISAEGGKKTT